MEAITNAPTQHYHLPRPEPNTPIEYGKMIASYGGDTLYDRGGEIPIKNKISEKETKKIQ